jgi:NitT/TauT family transport system ATP-binding protein/nitrate/nitrite transport system substrate-binding protein
MSDVIRLGILRLADAAPIILAEQEGVFASHNVNVTVSVEPSWANIADKVGYGLLDGAVMMPPLAIACVLGLRGRKTDLVVPMSLSANGTALTLAARWQSLFNDGGVAALVRKQKLRIAVVHAYSNHDLLLRYWLAANDVDPDTGAEIIAVSPAEMVGSLAAGGIDGFFAGAPWGQVAMQSNLGFTAVRSDEIWKDHPEKCLALRGDVASGDPARVRGLLAALTDAATYCANPARRSGIAAMLGQPDYLDLPAAVIEKSMDPTIGGPNFSMNYPAPSHAAWFAMQMLRWDKAPSDVLGAAASMYRPDLFIDAGGKAPEGRKEVFCDGA